MVVYVTTPLGSGTAQISLPVVRHFLQVCPPCPSLHARHLSTSKSVDNGWRVLLKLILSCQYVIFSCQLHHTRDAAGGGGAPVCGGGAAAAAAVSGAAHIAAGEAQHHAGLCGGGSRGRGVRRRLAARRQHPRGRAQPCLYCLHARCCPPFHHDVPRVHSFVFFSPLLGGLDSSCASAQVNFIKTDTGRPSAGTSRSMATMTCDTDGMLAHFTAVQRSAVSWCLVRVLSSCAGMVRHPRLKH